MSNKNKIILISSIVLVFLVGIILFNTLDKENTIKTYKVTFTSGNGEVIEQTVNEGETITVPEEPEKEGYLFVGWRYEGDVFDFSKGVNEDINLVAEWKEIKENIETFVVKFDTDGGTTIANQVIEKGEKVSKPITPTKEGYTFKYWMLNDKEYDFGKAVNENITLKASWEKVNNPVNNNQNNNTNNNVNNNNNNSNTNKPENIKVATPTLINTGSGTGTTEYVGFENGKYIYDLAIKNYTDYCNTTNNKCSAAGFEVYEKIGTEYKYVASGKMGGAADVKIEAGTKKTLVARVYQYNSSNKKVYSSYSNEVVLDNSTYKTPVLINAGSGTGTTEFVGFENGKYIYDLGLKNYTDYCNGTNYICSVAGYEVYEKNGAEYKYIASGKMGGAADVKVEVGTKKTLVARVYQYNASNKKVYSNYSNEIVLDNTKVAAPTLSIGGGTTGTIKSYLLEITKEGTYAVAGNKNTIKGWELYEKNGSGYNLVKTITSLTTHEIILDIGESKTYVAKAYSLNASGTKVYSGYSKELVLDNSKVEMPTISVGGGAGGTIKSYLLEITREGTYAVESNRNNINGWELYEKNGSGYNLVKTITSLTTHEIILDIGESKTYVARAYAVNKNGTKIYSRYSNEIVLDNSKIATPTLINAGSGTGTTEYVGFENGKYIYDLAIKNYTDYCNATNNTCSVSGYEVYEKNGTEYKYIMSAEMGGAADVKIEAGTKRILVARVYAINKAGTRLYSNYSNEVLLDAPSN